MASRKPLLRKNNDTDGEEIQEEVIVHYERSQENSTGSTSTVRAVQVHLDKRLARGQQQQYQRKERKKGDVSGRTPRSCSR